MWSLRLREDGSFYLTYDKDRWFTNNLPGIWELVGPKDSAQTKHCTAINFICWICEGNRAYREYEGTELLSEEGEKPCLECIQESENQKEELENESDV